MTRFTLPAPQGATTVVVGALAAVPELAALGRTDRPVTVVSEPHVWSLHGHALPFAADPLLVPRGEQAKQWPALIALLDRFAGRGLARSDTVVAFGGGAVGDVAGLAASLFKRGVDLVQLPTTLLAQADSALGGKTAIDAAGQKNLVGSFYPARLLVADPALLATLPEREARAGYAEIYKYGLIADAAFADWCHAHAHALLAGDPALRAEAIARALRFKADHVAGDVEDRGGRRALLNFGHSFAHAIERMAGLGTLLHGEAVAVGMVLAARFSGVDADAIAAHLSSVGLPTRLADLGLKADAAGLLAAMRDDKKNSDGAFRLVLLDRIGQARLAPVDEQALAAFLATAA